MTESQLRRFIRNQLLSETAKGPQDLPDGIYIKVYDDEVGGTVKYACNLYKDPLENTMKAPISGIVKWSKTLGGQPNEIDLTDATQGWGPLLYDIAIEMSGKLGLMSDRWEVSEFAQKVWDYYLYNRPDIEKIQLDNKQNELTPTPKDNVDQDMAEQDPKTKHWYDSSLSKAYRANGTPAIDKLKALNKIQFMDSNGSQSQTVKSFLKGTQK